jgi:hypothetical protein
MTVTAQQAADYLERATSAWHGWERDPNQIKIGGRVYQIEHAPMPGRLISRIGWLHGANRTLGVILRNHTTGLIYVTGMTTLDQVPHRETHRALTAALTPDRRTA